MARRWQERFEDQQLQVETARNDAMFMKTEQTISQAKLRQSALRRSYDEAKAAQEACRAELRENLENRRLNVIQRRADQTRIDIQTFESTARVYLSVANTEALIAGFCVTGIIEFDVSYASSAVQMTSWAIGLFLIALCMFNIYICLTSVIFGTKLLYTGQGGWSSIQQAIAAVNQWRTVVLLLFSSTFMLFLIFAGWIVFAKLEIFGPNYNPNGNPDPNWNTYEFVYGGVAIFCFVFVPILLGIWVLQKQMVYFGEHKREASESLIPEEGDIEVNFVGAACHWMFDVFRWALCGCGSCCQPNYEGGSAGPSGPALRRAELAHKRHSSGGDSKHRRALEVGDFVTLLTRGGAPGTICKIERPPSSSTPGGSASKSGAVPLEYTVIEINTGKKLRLSASQIAPVNLHGIYYGFHLYSI